MATNCSHKNMPIKAHLQRRETLVSLCNMYGMLMVGVKLFMKYTYKPICIDLFEYCFISDKFISRSLKNMENYSQLFCGDLQL